MNNVRSGKKGSNFDFERLVEILSDICQFDIEINESTTLIDDLELDDMDFVEIRKRVYCDLDVELEEFFEAITYEDALFTSNFDLEAHFPEKSIKLNKLTVKILFDFIEFEKK
jgi:hypothetical protein